MNKHRLLLFLALLLSELTFGQYSALDNASTQRIENFVESFKSSERMVGVSVGVIKNGKIAYLGGFGYSDKELNIEATENSIYRVASVSKSITGLLAMKLKQKGKLDLNKNIREYVPEYPQKPQGTITSKDLLSNQSGIIHYSGTSSGQFCSEGYDWRARNEYIENHTTHFDPVAAINTFKEQKICFKPGDHYQYTTWGFCLMGAVIERASESSYEQALYDEIIAPLNLPNLQPELQAYRPYLNAVKGYEFNSNGAVISTPTTYTDYQDISYKVPAGGLICSVVDLTRLIQGVVNREVLDENLLNEWSQQRVPADGVNSYYGFGIGSGSRNGNKLLSHSGSQAQTATLIYFSPDNRNGLAIMSNTRGVSLWNLARAIYDYIPRANYIGGTYNMPCQNILNIPNANPQEIPYNGQDDDCNPATLDDDLDQDGYVLAEDCDDNNSNINPSAAEIPYNGQDDDCNPATLDDDLDQDGYVLAEDCDDNNSNINPSVAEIPYNGLDEDCNPATLDDDLDQDGYVLAEDCDDHNSNINPSAVEISDNGIDEDCNGTDLISSSEDCDEFAMNLRNSVNPSCANNDGKFDVTIDGGTPSFTIAWSGVSSGSETISGRWFSIKNLASGNYTVMVTDSSACSQTDSILLNLPMDCEEEEEDCDDFAMNLRNLVNPSCANNDGKFDVTIDGGTPSFTIAWEGASSGSETISGRWFSIKNLASGDYTVMVTDSSACSQTDSIRLNLPMDCEEEEDNCDDFVMNLRNLVNPSCANNDGKFDVTIDGGTPSFTIVWEGTSSNRETINERKLSIENLASGDYTVMVTDSSACSQTDSIRLNLPMGCEEEEDCSEITMLLCDMPLDDSTIGGTNTFTANDYDCYSQASNFNGNDKIYRLEVTPNTSSVTIHLTRMNKDLDIFVLDGCELGANCIAESRHNPAYLEERITMENLTAGTYYVVVDGTTMNENSNFRLSATCQHSNLTNNSSKYTSTINNLEMYPNPSNGVLMVRANLLEISNVQLEVINAIGQTIATYNAGATDFVQHQFDLSGATAGLYFLKLQTATNLHIEQVILVP